MPLRNARAVAFRPTGLSDTADSTTAFPGALAVATDLIPSMHTKSVWVPRPASFLFIDFGREVTGEGLLVIGLRIYGLVTSGRFPGFSEPFAYDVEKHRFIPIVGIEATNIPKSQPLTGDWEPPTATPVGAYILFASTGFSMPNAFGWLDMTGFSDTATGTTGFGFLPSLWRSAVWNKDLWAGTNPGGGTVIADLSKNVLLAGWRPGMMVSDSAGVIPPDTRIVAISPDGLAIVISNSSSGAVVGDTLTVLGGTPDAALWAAGNTSINPLPFVAAAVSNFNGRAYFAVKSATPFTDAYDPLIRTEAGNVLTYENGFDVTAFATIPFATQLGGVVQSLLAFQGDAAIQQIQGDPATQNLSKNLLATLGTLAPNALTPMPFGVGFIAPDGARIIGKDGSVSDPIGVAGDGVALPFINSVYPSRITGAYNEDVWRISVTYNKSEDGVAGSAVVSGEFWYHLKLKMWSGPHSFPAALTAPLDFGTALHGHVMFPLHANDSGGIWFSNTRPMLNSGYIENGAQMRWLLETSLVPDTQQMFMNAVNETTIMMAMPPGEVIEVSVVDEAGDLIDSVELKGATPLAARWGLALYGSGRWGGRPAPAGIWGAAIWGKSIWGNAAVGTVLAQRLVPWDHELVFKQCRMVIAGQSSAQTALGSIYVRYQQTGYTITDQAGVSS